MCYRVTQKDSKCLLSLFQWVKISHVFRESNTVANIMANRGIEHHEIKDFQTFEEHPKKARGAILLDRIRLQNIREKNNVFALYFCKNCNCIDFSIIFSLS